MSHHSSIPADGQFSAARSRFIQQMEIEAQRLNLGATGRSPSGQVHETDEGEIRMGVAHDAQERKVFLNFGKPVAWLGLNPEEAFDLGELLIRHSREVRGINDEAVKPSGRPAQTEGTL